MTVIKCDKCGKEISSKLFNYLITIEGFKLYNIKVDLCEDCKNELLKWLNITHN